MTAIRIEHLSKSFGAFSAVSDLSLDIPDGTVFGLLGPNGAGKTTTFKCMLGLVRPTSGTIRFNGKPLTPPALNDIAYIPEQDVLYGWMTIAEHVEMMRRAFSNFSVARCNELLAQFSLDPKKKTRALSKGMRTATAVSLAFARDCGVLVLDEPTSGLDPVNQRVVLNLIINAATRGCTVLFSSHQIGQVERAAERIAILQRGRLTLEGTIDDLKAGRKIVEGILPDETASIDRFAHDPRILRADKEGRIARLLAQQDPEGVAHDLAADGAQGVRVIDLNLEDIFLNAVTPSSMTGDAVERV